MMTAEHSSKRWLMNSRQHTGKLLITKEKQQKRATMLLFFVSLSESELSYELINSLVKLFYCVEVIVPDGIDDTGRHMLFKDHPAHRFDG